MSATAGHTNHKANFVNTGLFTAYYGRHTRHYYDKGYDVVLFANTGHVESIALLERVSNRKADAKVHIDVDLEDYYRIKDAQGKDGK